ncbi:MAG: bifunctional nuclease family protein [Bacteroidales bacterium]|nr:bifunctional nuclease family protein [Bacteroidales bacterium]
MDKIKLEILGMSYSQSQSGAYALILGEVDGKRRLPIIIGGFEAQAIAIELEKMKPARPLTHDLLKRVADAYGVRVNEVIINKFFEGVFYAQLICDDGKQVMEIDSRTSDAVAIALRFNCPIYTFENIMSQAGIVVQDNKDEKQEAEEWFGEKEDSPYERFSIAELEDMIQKAVELEEYEKASKIRDEIKRRERTK